MRRTVEYATCDFCLQGELPSQLSAVKMGQSGWFKGREACPSCYKKISDFLETLPTTQTKYKSRWWHGFVLW